MELNNLNWNEYDYEKFIQYLKSNSDEKYKVFIESLTPGLSSALGIRMPKLRVIAKEISKGNYSNFFNIVKHKYYEETMIHGLVITYVKTDYENKLKLIKSYLPYVTNWALCDSFCVKQKPLLENREEFFKFLIECINTGEEYYIRYAVIMFKVMYLDDDFIDKIYNILNNIHKEEYYVKMAIAWNLSECFIKYEDKTLNYLKNNNLDDFTYNKALQKIIESNRVDVNKKEKLKEMKRK